MKAKMALAAVVCALGVANAYELDNGVLTVNVAAGDTQSGFTTDQLAALADADCTELRKTGGGTLALTDSTGLKNFKGTIRISDGVYLLDVQATGFLGTTDGPTIVESGATLKAARYVGIGYYGDEDLRIAGTGYGSEGGAIVASADVGNLNLGRLTLTADATVLSPGKQNFTFYNYPIDMGGFTLTMKGKCALRPKSLTNPGHLIFDGLGESCSVEVPQSCDFPGGPEHTMSFTNGAYAQMYEASHTNKVYWTIRLYSPQCTFGTKNLANSGFAEFRWYGPVELPASGTATFSSNTKSLHLLGPISGGADIAIASQGGLPVEEDLTAAAVFLSGTNTYTGTLTVSNGRCVLLSEDAVPGWDAGRLVSTKTSTSYGVYFAGSNSTLPSAWSPERIGAAFKRFRTAGKWNVGLYAAAGTETVCELPDPDAGGLDYSDQYLFTLGSGRKVIKGNYGGSGLGNFKLYYMAADLDVIYSAKDPATASHQLGNFVVRSTGKVAFENMGYTEICGYPEIGAGTSANATFIVGTNTVLGLGTGGKALYAPYGKNTRAVVRILPGAVVSNGVWLGVQSTYSNACGMAVQKGGLVYSKGNSTRFGTAVGGMGYYELAGGRFASAIEVLSGLEAGCSGFLRQTGGEFEMLPSAPYLEIGAAGTGLVHVVGGSFKSATGVYAPKSTSATSRSGCGRFSVANGARPLCEKGVFLADRIDAEGSVDLLGGGVLETPSVTRCATLSYKSSVSTGNATAYVNFNGGGLCAISNDVELLGSGSTALTRATVYSAGAILEAAQDVSANVSVPLQAATGGGLSALALPEGGVSGCRCSPVVQIFGDGIGAAAVAEYDSDADTVTGITVTSPGWGYTAANTTAVLHWCGNTGKLPNIALSVTVTDAASLPAGGLTKRGEGRIALAAANAYGGDTVIEKGTLAALVPGAIPSDSAVTVMPGGAIELASGVGYPADLTVDLDGADGSLRYPVILCPDGMPEGVPSVKGIPAGWTLRLRGTTWEAAHLRGSVFCIR